MTTDDEKRALTSGVCIASTSTVHGLDHILHYPGGHEARTGARAHTLTPASAMVGTSGMLDDAWRW
jgi:hypothetical protein